MADFIIIRLQADPDAPVSWVYTDSTGASIGEAQSGALSEAAEAVGARKAAVLVPAVDVLATRAQVPVRGSGKLSRVLPYALEEQLAEDIESLHFAHGKRSRDGSVVVAVVARQRLDGWLGRLSDAGINADAMHTEAVGVPHTPGGYTVFIDDGLCYVREPDERITVFDDQSLNRVLELFGLQADRVLDEDTPPVHLSFYLSEKDHQRYAATLEGMQQWAASVDVKLLPENPLPTLAARTVGQVAVNMLQGDYAPKSSVAVLWQPWRVAAALLAAAIVLNVVLKVAELADLTGREEQLDETVLAIFQSTLPGARAVNPRSQFSQVLASLTGVGGEGDEFLQSLATVGSALDATPGTELGALRYQNRIMDLKLTAPSVDALDNIRRRVMDESDRSAQILRTEPGENRVEGRMQVKGPGA